MTITVTCGRCDGAILDTEEVHVLTTGRTSAAYGEDGGVPEPEPDVTLLCTRCMTRIYEYLACETELTTS